MDSFQKCFWLMSCMQDTYWLKFYYGKDPYVWDDFPNIQTPQISRYSSRWYKWPRRWTYSSGSHPGFCVQSVDFRQHIHRPPSFFHQVRSTHRSPAPSTASEMLQHGGRCTDRLKKTFRLRVYFVFNVRINSKNIKL